MWVIELENQGYTQSFGTPSADPYLARTLMRMGALLENYYAIGHSNAANYVAQVSGLAPDLGTESDCPLWVPFTGQVIAGPYHQVLTCAATATTHPASPAPPGGLAQADAFLSQWVPKIMDAPAYRDGGLIVVTFDEGSDPAACCGEACGLQPLLAAAHHGGHLRPAAPARRGHAAGQIVRPGRIRLVHAVNHFGIGPALGVSHENTVEQNMDQLRRMWSGRQPFRDSPRLDWFIAGVGSKDESRR